MTDAGAFLRARFAARRAIEKTDIADIVGISDPPRRSGARAPVMPAIQGDNSDIAALVAGPFNGGEHGMG